MVLLIKATNNMYSDMKKVAAQMVNMESNQKVYDEHGTATFADEKTTKRPKFNTYEHNSVEFDFNLSFGIILIYSKSDGGHAQAISDEIKKLGVPANVSEFVHKKSDYYTMVKSEVLSKDTASQNVNNSRKCFRKIITDPYYLKRAWSGNNTRFVWLIVNKIAGNFRGSHLKIEEIEPSTQTEVYLNRSICTIVYDGLNIFNMPNMTKQIDYPTLNQYNIFKNKQILEDPIYMSWTGGLRYEIYYQFTKKSPSFLHINTSNPQNEIFNPLSTESKFDDVALKRLNPDKDWKKQLQEPFDYKKQEDDEVKLVDEGKPKFPNDVCFISKIPLWYKFYMVRIKNATDEFDIAVTPSVMHQSYEFGKVFHDLRQVINLIENVTFTSVRVCEHPRTFLEILDLIDIHPIKKNIMRCIETHGCFAKANDVGNRDQSYSRYAHQYYTKDKSTNQIYVGVVGCNDSHVVAYQNTETILFRVIVVETQPRGTQDLLLFSDQRFG